MATKFFDSVIKLTFVQTRVAKEKFYGARKPIKIWYVDANDIVISKLIKTKINFKYLTEYFYGSNMIEGCVECDSFRIIYIDSILVHENKNV